MPDPLVIPAPQASVFDAMLAVLQQILAVEQQSLAVAQSTAAAVVQLQTTAQQQLTVAQQNLKVSVESLEVLQNIEDIFRLDEPPAKLNVAYEKVLGAKKAVAAKKPGKSKSSKRLR
jgi:hypothetical protein